jgi:hypothetical protein
MLWNDHWKLEGKHAYLGASKYHWINYTEEKLRAHFRKHMRAQEGTELHALAKLLIDKRIKQIRNGKTFNTYVNDAIGFKMDTEVPLFYCDDIFGTPDAICFRDMVLRIHDLKTGEFPGSFNQLKIYFALFFLEYEKLLKIKPHDVEMFGRIYQNDVVLEEKMDPDEILALMEWAKKARKIIEEEKEVMM